MSLGDLSVPPILLEGLAADTKPITWLAPGNVNQAVPPRSSFIETDTGDEYYYAGKWVLYKRNGSPVSLLDSTAFGEIATAEPTPIVQLQFPYSVNPRQLTSLTAGSGAASVAKSLLTVSSGTTTASDVLLTSNKFAKYQPGQGTLVRFTAIFQATGTAGTEAFIGLGNQEDGLFFGYDGESFGLLHRFDGKQEYQTLTITTGAVTAGGTITITLDGVATTTEITNGGSTQAVAREIGATTYVEWETQIIGNTIVFISHHAEVKAGSFSFADTDTTGVVASFTRNIIGAAHEDEWHAQTTWNVDTMDGDKDEANPSGQKLVVSNGNVYQIRFQWLGFGAIYFYVENSDTGDFQLVHIEKYSNINTTPSLQNPTLPLNISVDNEATTTDIVVKTASMAVFTEGVVDVIQGFNNGVSSSKALSSTTETCILVIKNKPIFQGVANRVEFRPLVVTFSAKGGGAAKITTFRVHVNPILGGDPVFTDISTTTSVLSTDTAATTVSGGNKLAQFNFGANVESFVVNLADLSQEQPPGLLVAFTAEIDGGTSDINISVIVRELF